MIAWPKVKLRLNFAGESTKFVRRSIFCVTLMMVTIPSVASWAMAPRSLKRIPCHVGVSLSERLSAFSSHRRAAATRVDFDAAQNPTLLAHSDQAQAKKHKPTTNTASAIAALDALKQNPKHEQHVWPPVVLLKRSPLTKSIRYGNQLVFTKTIIKTSGVTLGLNSPNDSLAQVVLVCVEPQTQKRQKGGNDNISSHRHKPEIIGWGVYNPKSLYKVRILHHLNSATQEDGSKLVWNTIDKDAETEEDVLRPILLHSFRRAQCLRQGLGLPREGENEFYRLVNGEGDGLSGLAVDVVSSNTAVLMSSASWCQIHKDIILDSLQEVLPDHRLVWKTTGNRLEQDGYDTTFLGTEQDDDVGDNQAMMNSHDVAVEQSVISRENGIQYLLYPFEDGQKTGVYCDQRENRRWLADSGYCRDRTVLDVCCYHGGFSLNALIRGGAKSAVGVDSSEAAIQICRQNAKLNGLNDSQLRFERASAIEYLQEAFKRNEFYDLIVLDPPKLAPSAALLEKARRKYHAFNRDAIKLVSPNTGGFLLTCTCSAAMTQKDGGQYFLGTVHGAAQAAGRHVTFLHRFGAAPCHTQAPLSFPAGEYLTAALFYVHPKTTIGAEK